MRHGRAAVLSVALCCLAPGACERGKPGAAGTPSSARPTAVITPYPPSVTPVPPSPPLVRAARAQIGVTTRYDPAYVSLPYPGGDVPRDRGVCTDVVIRALRRQGIDLQRAIHEDRIAHPPAYTQGRNRSPVDRSIDHRRVPNQMIWLTRQGWSLPITAQAGDYAAGDIVAWRLRGNGLLHIGIVSDRTTGAGLPLVLHNIGGGTREEALLFDHPIIGHYRPALPATAATRW